MEDLEGTFIPIIAKRRWPTINANTWIVLCNHSRLVIPVMPDIIPLWWDDYDVARPIFENEEIILHRVTGIDNIVALGYSERINTLAMQIMQ